MNAFKTLPFLVLAAAAAAVPGLAQMEPQDPQQPAQQTPMQQPMQQQSIPAETSGTMDGMGLILTPVPPATKLEGVLAVKGTVVLKRFTEIGTIPGEDGAAIRVLAVRFQDSRLAPEFGAVIEVRQSRGFERTAVAYVDEDEIDALVAALDALGRLERLDFDDFEGVYRSRGSLEVENQSYNGSRSIALRATEVHAPTGRVVWSTARYRLSSLPEMGRMLNAAKDVLVAAKTIKPEGDK